MKRAVIGSDRAPIPDTLNEMHRGNLRALLKALRRSEGSWPRVARAVGMRRGTVKAFADGETAGNMALARSVSKAIGLDLMVALDGRFVIGESGVRPLKGGAS